MSPVLLPQAGPGLVAEATVGDPAQRGSDLVPDTLERSDSAALEPLAGANLSSAWQRSRGSPGVTVAVLDSGVDRSHEDLSRVLPGWDARNENLAPGDDCGHGTRVAGILGADQTNAVGVAGVAQATILPVKVLGESEEGCTGSTAVLEDAIHWAIEARAEVIAIPLGCASPCWDEDVEAAVADARQEGALVVASAGNEPSQGTYFPASVPGALAVGALDRDESPRHPGFPEPGPDLLAPGQSLATTAPGDTYDRLSGASAAVPVVAGAAALALSLADLSPDEVTRLLQGTASDLGGTNATHEPGALDAGAALQHAENGTLPAAPGLGDTWTGTDRTARVLSPTTGFP